MGGGWSHSACGSEYRRAGWPTAATTASAGERQRPRASEVRQCGREQLGKGPGRDGGAQRGPRRLHYFDSRGSSPTLLTQHFGLKGLGRTIHKPFVEPRDVAQSSGIPRGQPATFPTAYSQRRAQPWRAAAVYSQRWQRFAQPSSLSQSQTLGCAPRRPPPPQLRSTQPCSWPICRGMSTRSV